MKVDKRCGHMKFAVEVEVLPVKKLEKFKKNLSPRHYYYLLISTFSWSDLKNTKQAEKGVWEENKEIAKEWGHTSMLTFWVCK